MTRVGRSRNSPKISFGGVEGSLKKGRLEDLGVDGSTVLKCIPQIEGEGLD